MISKRSIVLTLLISLPVLIFAAVGGYAIWENGNLNWIWWLMTGCGLAAWLVAMFWKPQPTSSQKSHQLAEPTHWTPRDRQAAELVREYQQRVESLSTDELTDPHFYLTQVQSLALDLARLYHPNAADPFERLTVPEVLAAVRLAGDDMERWMLESVPGSRMLTIRHWQMMQHAPEWLTTISEATWGRVGALQSGQHCALCRLQMDVGSCHRAAAIRSPGGRLSAVSSVKLATTSSR